MTRRNVTATVDPRERYSLYRLCDCPTCGGRGQALMRKNVAPLVDALERCPDCRGEGRVRQELASCATAEAVGVALVTLAREGEWDADGEPCAFGLLDRMGKKGKKWLVLPWSAYTPRHVSEAARTLGKEGARKRSAR